MISEIEEPEVAYKIGFLYLMRNQRNGYVKIGFSKNPAYREKTLQSEEPEVSMIFKVEASFGCEGWLHARFAEKRLRGEWFALSEGDVSWIIEHAHKIDNLL